MNLMFWKKKTAVEAEPDTREVGSHKGAVEEEVPQGRAARLRVRLTALGARFRSSPLVARFRSSPSSDAEQDTALPARPGKLATAAPRKSDPPAKDLKAPATGKKAAALKKPLFSRTRLIIGGSIVLLAGAGVAAWLLLTAPQSHVGTRRENATGATHAVQPEAAAPKPQVQAEPPRAEPVAEKLQAQSQPPSAETVAAKPQAEADALKLEALRVEALRLEALKLETLKLETQKLEALNKENSELAALKKQNTELKAKIEAMKNRAVQPDVQTVSQAGGKAAQPPGIIETTVGNNDPKITAMTLKQAIEAMNNSASDYKKKTPNK